MDVNGTGHELKLEPRVFLSPADQREVLAALLLQAFVEAIGRRDASTG